MAQEHQEYIQSKVNPTLENLVTQVLLERPSNPVPFMVRWLAGQSKQGAKASLAQFGIGEAEQLRNEVKALQEEVRELEAKLGAAKSSASPAAKPSAEDEEEDDDVIDEVPEQLSSSKKPTGRTSVSAEAYGEWNKLRAFTPPVVPKSEDQKRRILEVLQQSFLFAALERENQGIIADAMVEKAAALGETLLKEGESGDVMFIIEQGAVDCLKGDQVVRRCSPGDFFGELALLYNCPRAATVVAREGCVLWQLDRGTFNHIVRDASRQKREMHDEFLAHVPLLESLGKYERSQIADALQQEAVAAGTVVIDQGKEGSRFYLVEEGELSAQKLEPGASAPKEVLAYKRGDYFGELALLQDDVRAASVVARTDAKLLWVDRKVFERLLGSLKDVMKEKAASQYG